MKSMAMTLKANLSLQNLLLGLAMGLGVLAIVENNGALMNGIQIVWSKNGYATLVLFPLTLLLASGVLRDMVESNPDRKALVRQYATVASLAPLAGYLGTVLGIMQAVHSLGAAESAESVIQMVGHTFHAMSVAFETTAWGLILAMIAIAMQRREKNQLETNPELSQLATISQQLQQIISNLDNTRRTAPWHWEEDSEGGMYDESEDN
jgi:hypothetical protein